MVFHGGYIYCPMPLLFWFYLSVLYVPCILLYLVLKALLCAVCTVPFAKHKLFVCFVRLECAVHYILEQKL